MKRNNKKSLKITLAVILLVISIGYALLNANLTINGTSNFARTTWNIHFENLQDNTNMTLGQNDSAAAITQNKTNEVTYAVSFNEPGQFYEFTVDAKNDGTIDGMINSVTSTIKIGNGEATPITTNPSNLPAYMSYTATYSDGTPIEQYHLLAANQKETYKVRVEFRTDIEATDLPGTDQTIELTFGVEYVQKDSNGTPVPHDSGIYTVNSFIGEGSVYLGQALPNTITTYQTPELAMAAYYNGPIFLKHTIENDIVTKSYVGFVVTAEMAENNPGMTAGIYYLRGGVDESSSSEKPIYEANKATLLSAFGSSYFYDYTNPDSTYSAGIVSGLNAAVYPNGFMTVDNSDSSRCDVTDGGESYCYRIP